MNDPLLDEDGRCWKTDLFPEDCACAVHRGGDLPDEEDVDYSEYLIHRFRLAKFHGRCKLVHSHEIDPGDNIGLAVYENDIDREFGWVCEPCTDQIAYPRRER